MNIVRGKNKAMGQSRDIGLDHGAGKGDAPRSNFSKAFRENMQAIEDATFTIPAALDRSFKQVGPNRYRKVFR